ncbi:myotubularin-related protein 10-B [Aricia agestis]|uniref:myotubularin-related protein 10-B n=1 Tax=Aricia agestis TaxID=91739 RepID=UPI001C208D83|nr:myotubularin-related protein 10-B [Aricia agestis]
MNDAKENFKSYIYPKNNGEKNGSLPEPKPKLLLGELVTGQAEQVSLLPALSDGRGRTGSLFITNYKLSFVPLDTHPSDEYGQKNYLLGPFDVPLTCVGALWQTDGGPNRRRRLLPRSDVPPKLKGLQIVCKNMKVLSFNFSRSPLGHGRQVALALLHHAHPRRHDLLFAFECRAPRRSPAPAPPSPLAYLRPADWRREIERTDTQHYRITCINGTSDAFMLSAGEALVVPRSALDWHVADAARHFRGGRVPVWTWGRGGAALLRCAELLPTERAPTAESVLLEQVRRSHPKLTPPHVMHLCGAGSGVGGGARLALPPLETLNAAYKKLVDLCTPTTLSIFWMQDSQYYSILDSSGWLRYVACCIALADEAAAHLANNETVVLQEGDGVDYCAVVSSLTQLMLDDHCRTIDGFQALIQKEWIALGHPFADRFGLPRPGGEEAGTPAPVFHLFLDCVWQLQRLWPTACEFTETYLTSLADSAHNHLFDTFLFNSPRDRELAVANRDYVQRPVWDWEEQFSDADIALFYNPLYERGADSRLTLNWSGSASGAASLAGAALASVEVWSQRYERWLPPLDAPHHPLHCLYRAHAQQTQRLSSRLSTISISSTRSVVPWPVSRFYPFGRGAGAAPLDVRDPVDADDLLDSQSLLNAPD